MNTNGVLDLSGPDRVTESATWFEQDLSSDFWQVRASVIYAGENSAVSTTNSIQKTRLTGLGSVSALGALSSEQSSFDLLGNQAISRSYIDRTAKTVSRL